jgi:putative endonuclease
MGKHRSTHHWSEDFALDQLQSRGLRLVARNYRTRRGEIDLVLQEDASLVFVEVRYRASIAFGRPEETVGAKKQSRLRLAAEAFLQRRQSGHDTACRFDVFAVSGPLPDPDWRWIQDAF